MVVDVMISQKIPPDKIFPRRYMNFEQKYQKDPGMNRVKKNIKSKMWYRVVFQDKEREKIKTNI